MDMLFPESYEASRRRFLQEADRLRARWASSHLETHALRDFPALSLDWLWAEPPVKENILLVSTAQHGIEGYVGAAMLKVCMDEFAPQIKSETTGLLLLHAINPWGMQNRLRVNANQVDLNRNFVFDGNYNPEINPDYELLENFLNPKRPVRTLRAEAIPFLARVIKNMIHPGRARVQAASLLGQHRHPRGMYFGGVEPQEETIVVTDLFRTALARYQNVFHVDIHTGYGPRYQMSVIVPPPDPNSSSALSRTLQYPLVQKIDAEEFYAISGDMGEYVYRLRDAEFPEKNVFACGFEFGTFGDSLPALIRSLRITVLENQLRHHGAVSTEAERQIRAEYEELFFPAEPGWREKAVVDCRQAFEGILAAYALV